ncbi:hypothetical protein ACVWYH_005524 [Bradyrhizobium sp. GM24.11]
MPLQRERQLSANFCHHGAQERLLAHQQRRTLRPTGRNIREHQRLYKTGARRGPTVSDQIGFDEARCRILPAGGRPYRDSVAMRSPPGGAAGVHLPLGSCPAPHRSSTRSPPAASHGFQAPGPCDRCVPSTRSGAAAALSATCRRSGRMPHKALPAHFVQLPRKSGDACAEPRIASSRLGAGASHAFDASPSQAQTGPEFAPSPRGSPLCSAVPQRPSALSESPMLSCLIIAPAVPSH